MEEDDNVSEGNGEWSITYKELKRDVKAHDNKEIFKLLTFSRTTTIKKEIEPLVKLEENRHIDRLYEKEELDKFRAALKKDLKSLKDQLKILSKNPDQISKIGPLTESIEKKVTNFQEKKMVNFDRLLEEEAILSAEIDMIAENIEEYETPVEPKEIPNLVKTNSFIIKTVKRTSLSAKTNKFDEDEDYLGGSDTDPMLETEKKMENLKEEINEIDKQLSNLGGLNLGWEKTDHDMFLKLKTKHGGDIESKSFLEEIIVEIPYKKDYEITEHAERYESYVELFERKKFLLEEYKSLKTVFNNTAAEVKKELELAKRKEPKPLYNEEDRLKIKEDLKVWKKKKILSHLTEKENQENEERLKRLERNHLHEVRRVEISKQVEDYKLGKQRDKIYTMELEAQRMLAQKKKISKEESIHLKEREDQLMKKRQDKITLMKLKNEEKIIKNEKILENAPNKFLNASSRLDEQTIAMQGKVREKFDPRRNLPKIADSFGGNFVRMTGKAMVGFRPPNNLL